jgi:hypothetical protein
VLASGRAADAESGTLPLNADAAVLAGTLAAGETARVTLEPGRSVYLVPATGTVEVNGVKVGTRDGAAISGEAELTITATEPSDVVLVDVAA